MGRFLGTKPEFSMKAAELLNWDLVNIPKTFGLEKEKYHINGDIFKSF